MGSLKHAMDFRAPPARAEGLWYDLERWSAWVDGFSRVLSVQGDWPRPGSVVVWESLPHGRGQVLERVLAHEPGRGQELEVSDQSLQGHQSVAFETLDAGVGVSLGLDYRLRDSGPVSALTDLFFIRRALGDSLRRTLARFGRELMEDSTPG